MHAAQFPIFLSTFSSLNIAQVGFRIEFSSLDPEYEYEAEADWALGPDQLLGGILRMSERVWPLDVAYSSRNEQAGGGNGIAPGTTARAVASPHGGMLLEWSTFMASTGRGACETEELSLTVRLIRVDAHDSNDSISAGDDSSAVAAASSVSIRTFGLKCPGLDGELRSERIVQEYPPEGRAIDRESLQRTGYVARVDYLHDRALYVFHLAFGDYVKTLEVEVIGDQLLRFELPLLPAGSHNFSLAVEALDWGVVARHEHAVIVVDGGLEEDGVIGGGRRLSEGWILDREWCGRSEVNGMTCTNDGHRAEGAPFVSGAGKVGAGGGGDVDGGAGDGLGAAGGAPGDVPSRGDLCGKLHEAGVEKMAFVGDSFAFYHYVSLILLLTGDFVRGARKPGVHAPDYCNGWGQYSSGECRKLIDHEPGTVVALCGGNLVVRQGSKLRKTCISVMLQGHHERTTRRSHTVGVPSWSLSVFFWLFILCFLDLPVYLSIYLPNYLFIHPSIYLSIYPSTSLTGTFFLYLSFYPSISRYPWQITYIKDAMDRLGNHPLERTWRDASLDRRSELAAVQWDTIVWSEGRHAVDRAISDADRQVGQI